MITDAHLPVAKLTGTLVDGTGQPVRGSAFLHPKGYPSLACRSISRGGIIEFPAVPAGHYVLSYEGSGKTRTPVRELTLEYGVHRKLAEVPVK